MVFFFPQIFSKLKINPHLKCHFLKLEWVVELFAREQMNEWCGLHGFNHFIYETKKIICEPLPLFSWTFSWICGIDIYELFEYIWIAKGVWITWLCVYVLRKLINWIAHFSVKRILICSSVYRYIRMIYLFTSSRKTIYESSNIANRMAQKKIHEQINIWWLLHKVWHCTFW